MKLQKIFESLDMEIVSDFSKEIWISLPQPRTHFKHFRNDIKDGKMNRFVVLNWDESQLNLDLSEIWKKKFNFMVSGVFESIGNVWMSVFFVIWWAFNWIAHTKKRAFWLYTNIPSSPNHRLRYILTRSI